MGKLSGSHAVLQHRRVPSFIASFLLSFGLQTSESYLPPVQRKASREEEGGGRKGKDERRAVLKARSNCSFASYSFTNVSNLHPSVLSEPKADWDGRGPAPPWEQDDDLLAEVTAFARHHLGMEPRRDRRLLWIAYEAMTAPLPKGWSRDYTDDGIPYYWCGVESTLGHDDTLRVVVMVVMAL